MLLKVKCAILVCSLSHVLAGYCPKSETVLKTCTRKDRYTTRCGFLWLSRCSRYRTGYFTCTKTEISYVCCAGWAGGTCSTPLCDGATTCPNGGTCQSPDTCSCKTGFSPPKCADTNECLSGNGGCQHTCTNTHGSFKCTCRSGYTLASDLVSCIDINECDVSNGGCQQKCDNLQGTFRCICNDGYLLDSDNISCSDEDECTRDVCHHNCTNTAGSYSCSCRSGYSLALNKVDCIDVDECLDIHVCDHLCHNTEGSYHCSCNDGYRLLEDGTSCSDVNECDENNGGCQFTCVNSAGSYACTCPAGYTLNKDQHACDDIDECAKGSSGCSHECTNSIGSFVCDCPDGYQLGVQHRTCEDIDDCKENECRNGGLCVDALMSYSCSCKDGFEGRFCEKDRDECGLLNGGCQDICTNADGSFACSCHDNRTLGTNGFSCKGSSSKDTVFKQHNILGKGLPRGCWMLPLASCEDGHDLNLTLSSTSEWYTIEISNDTSIIESTAVFSHGIVFIEVNKIAIPISLDGVEIHDYLGNFQLALGVSSENDGKGMATGVMRSQDCLNFNVSRSDKFEFIQAGSFMNSVFVSLISFLPNWVQFRKATTSILKVDDLRTSLIYGTSIDNDYWCKGAPVFQDHLYSVFKFGSSFELDIYGQSINTPSLLSGEKFCLIIDVCQSYGATVFLMLPDGSRGILSKISSFKTLFENNGFYIEPRGIGISLVQGINVHHQKTQLELWNGDEFFNYPITGHASVWLGGNAVYNESSYLTAKGQADIFVSVPNIDRILTGVFIDEWSGLVSMKAAATAILKFKLFGKQYKIDFTDLITGSIDTYMSIGGTEDRIRCGETANPSGIYLAALVTINPFNTVPILKDWVFDNTHKVYAFFMTDPSSNFHNVVPINIEKDIVDLSGMLKRMKTFLENVYDDLKEFIVSNISILIQDIVKSVDTLLKILSNIKYGNWTRTLEVFDELWKAIRKLEEDSNTFLDTADLFVDILTDNVTTFVRTEVEIVKDNFNGVMLKLQEQVSSLIKDYDGFGFKYHTSLKLFGLKIAGLDVEFVYSTSRLFSCSRFDIVYKLLQGKPAARFLARVSQEKKLGYFLKVDRGVGIGMAFAIESGEVVAQFQVFASLLGVKATADLFITNQHLALYTELNVWNIFLAQLDVIAEHGKDWYDLTLQVRGRFVAKARRKRQIQTRPDSFNSSYLDALIKVIRTMSDEAKRRLSQVQNALTIAQSGLSKAQTWLEDKKDDVRKANTVFDSAVESLERAKQKLENAKEPYRNALRKLEAAQIKVDNLCKIRSCKKICIPGIKCRICWKKVWFAKIPYPCCKFTSCMISFPNPICILANLLCRAVRALAYLALEVAKIFVRAVMLVYDVAKLAISVAQVIVDKSRFVLDVAEGILTLAQLGLEGAKGVLEAAKLALEAIKFVIGVAVTVLEFVIEYGVKAIIDVRNCGFDIELSTTDLPVFDVSCEVNAFKLGWKTVRLRINFKNVFQSIWQAAKATIKAILNAFGGLLSLRKRRNISFYSTSLIHTLLRKVRSADDEGMNATQQAAGELLDSLVYTDGFDNNTVSDYENRVNLFHHKCLTTVNIFTFLNETFSTLFEIANETNAGLESTILVKSQIHKYNVTDIANNMTLQESGVDANVAMRDYNISKSELELILNASMAKTVNDPMLNEIESIVELSSESVDAEIAGAESVQILNQWLLAMDNTTNDYFNDTECVKFRDCVHHSIALLYDLYTEEDLPEIETIQSAIQSLEDNIVNVFQNFSSSIPDTFSVSSTIMTNIQLLSSLNVFCSKPPVFTTNMKNYTAMVGSSVIIDCMVFADPEPLFWWYIDGKYISELKSKSVTITNVTTDHAAIYQCIAGNIVANISSEDIHLIVIPYQDFEEQKETVFPIDVTIIGGVSAILMISTIAAIVVHLCRSRKPRIRITKISEHIYRNDDGTRRPGHVYHNDSRTKIPEHIYRNDSSTRRPGHDYRNDSSSRRPGHVYRNDSSTRRPGHIYSNDVSAEIASVASGNSYTQFPAGRRSGHHSLREQAYVEDWDVYY